LPKEGLQEDEIVQNTELNDKRIVGDGKGHHRLGTETTINAVWTRSQNGGDEMSKESTRMSIIGEA
jgi:hypothetical protein